MDDLEKELLEQRIDKLEDALIRLISYQQNDLGYATSKQLISIIKPESEIA